jgi:hypothetical protein
MTELFRKSASLLRIFYKKMKKSLAAGSDLPLKTGWQRLLKIDFKQ